MFSGAAVMGIINDGGDTRVNAAQSRQQVADIIIRWTIVFSERKVRGVTIIFQTGGIRVDAA